LAALLARDVHAASSVSQVATCGTSARSLVLPLMLSAVLLARLMTAMAQY
jgi:hypothetical protein